MFFKKGIVDERITFTKQKIASEAYGLMFYALMGIIFVKSVILRIPIEDFITEFLLWTGVSLFVFIRMIATGVYAVNIRNSKKHKLKHTLLLVSVFMVTLMVIMYVKGSLNFPYIFATGIMYCIALYIVIRISEKRSNKLSESDEDNLSDT